jgi:outer membrane murein-binding lipoprotein Lpp
MGEMTVITALAGLGLLLAAVVIGVLIVLGGRSHDKRNSDRVRQFFSDRWRAGRGH